MALIYICQPHAFNADKGVFETVLFANIAQNIYMGVGSDETVAQAISRIEGQGSSGGGSATFDSLLEQKKLKLDVIRASNEMSETIRNDTTNKIIATRITTKMSRKKTKQEIKYYNTDGSVSRAVSVFVTRNADGSVTITTE